MVKAFFCDRCGKKLNTSISRSSNDEFPDDFDRLFEEMNERLNQDFQVDSQKSTAIKKIIRPDHLCDSCAKGYNQIIDDANEEIKMYMKNDTIIEKKRHKFFK